MAIFQRDRHRWRFEGREPLAAPAHRRWNAVPECQVAIETAPRRVEKCQNPFYPFGKFGIVAPQFGGGKTRGEFIPQAVAMIAELDSADASLGGRHQHPAEITFDHRIANMLPRATVSVLGRRHAEMIGGFFVASAAGPEPSLVHGLGNGSIFAQIFLKPPHPASDSVNFRRDANGLLEQPLEVERAEADRCGQRFQGGWRFGLLDDPARSQAIPFRKDRRRDRIVLAGGNDRHAR